jgi:molybdopterin-guanine dinucleotide biosynthesis protein B
MTHKVIGVAGFKNAGKTTLVERLVRELTGRGYRVSTVKHAHHSFDIILAKLAPADLVIVEGYKHGRHDKIEVRNLTLDHPKLAGTDPTIVAIAANGALADTQVPVFDRDHVEALADFIITHMRLDPK